MSPLIDCVDISKTFGRGRSAVVAIHGTSCAVRPRDRIAIVGASGSGKSTLLHLLAGLEQPTTGRISRASAAAAGALGVVFQSQSLIPTLTVAENVSLPLALDPVDGNEDEIVEAALSVVGAAEWADKLPEELSGGQAQRVAVARVLAQQPRVILADEPTGQLDRATGQRVIDALLAASDRLDAALVITTHDPLVARQLAVVWTMQRGRLTVPETVRGVA